MLQWLAADASAVGIGNSLYKSGDNLAQVKNNVTLLNENLTTV